jgi:hypothetical protein
VFLCSYDRNPRQSPRRRSENHSSLRFGPREGMKRIRECKESGRNLNRVRQRNHTMIPSVSLGEGEIHNDIQGVEQSATGRTQLSEARSEYRPGMACVFRRSHRRHGHLRKLAVSPDCASKSHARSDGHRQLVAGSQKVSFSLRWPASCGLFFAPKQM